MRTRVWGMLLSYSVPRTSVFLESTINVDIVGAKGETTCPNTFTCGPC